MDKFFLDELKKPLKHFVFIDIYYLISYVIEILNISILHQEGFMNKLDLVEALRKETELNKLETRKIVDLFFNEMSTALANGDRCQRSFKIEPFSVVRFEPH